MNLKELSGQIGQSPPYVMNLQKAYGLPVCFDYPEGYAALLSKIHYLALFSISKKDISAHLLRERKLLELLKADSVTASPLWFESLCVMSTGPSHLLLSGYDLGHHLNANVVQTGLDFAERDDELFTGLEMGESEMLALKACRDSQTQIMSRLRQQIPSVAAALKWGRGVANKSVL